MYNDVHDHVTKHCLTCKAVKVDHKDPRDKLHPVVATKSWEIIGLDLIGKLPDDGSEISHS